MAFNQLKVHPFQNLWFQICQPAPLHQGKVDPAKVAALEKELQQEVAKRSSDVAQVKIDVTENTNAKAKALEKRIDGIEAEAASGGGKKSATEDKLERAVEKVVNIEKVLAELRAETSAEKEKAARTEEQVKSMTKEIERVERDSKERTETVVSQRLASSQEALKASQEAAQKETTAQLAGIKDLLIASGNTNKGVHASAESLGQA